MKTFEQLHGDRPYKHYLGNDFELIIFDDYKWGSPAVLIKYLKRRGNNFENAFVELYGSSGSSSGNKKTYSLNNVWEEYIQKVQIWTLDDKAFVTRGSLDFEILDEIEKRNISQSSVLEIPYRRVIRFMYQFKESGDFIVVDKDEFHHNLKSKLYIGNNITGYEELEVLSDEMYRDGGTTNIETPKGLLYRPTPFRKELVATWTDELGTEYELDDVESNITNEKTLKLVHELLNIKEDKLLTSE